MHPILHEDAQRFRLSLAHQNVVLLPTTHAHIGANGAEDPPKCVRALPGDGESGDCAGASATDGSIVRVCRELDRASVRSGLPLDCRHDFLDQETAQPVTAAIELETAIEARI